MTERIRARLGPAWVVVVVLAMLAVVTAPAANAPESAAANPADSTHAAPAPLSRQVAPHDAVHGGGGSPGARGGTPSVPRPKPLRIVVPKGCPRVRSVTLGIRHRVFPDFAEQSEAVIGRAFQIGDTRFSATVTEFEPDFVIDPTRHSITSRSIEPRNPAFRLIVREGGVPQDTTWAFLNMAPHFMRNSLLAFEILRIDFADRPPLLRDSTALGRHKP